MRTPAALEQRDQFLALAVERAFDARDLEQAEKEQGLQPFSSAVDRLYQQQTLDTENQEEAILKPDQAAALRIFNRTEYPREVESAVAAQLYATEPLSATQAQAITDAFKSLSPAYQSGNSVGMDFDPAQLESLLAPVLKPSQINALSAQIEGDLAVRGLASAVFKVENSTQLNLAVETRPAKAP